MGIFQGVGSFYTLEFFEGEHQKDESSAAKFSRREFSGGIFEVDLH